ncbi:MAG TPA: NIPSNAP family protein [Rhodoblastus sp.]|nr:NIPSNAP family protein [Rhodoblastus sp.]
MSENLPLLDLRVYTIALRKTPDFIEVVDRLLMPVQLKYLRPPLFVATSAVGMLNQVVHVWEFADMGDFERRHAARDRDPGWPDYLKASGPLIVAQENRLIRRVALSSLARAQ